MEQQRTIAFIAAPKSHGPEGNGHHDYAWDACVAAAQLLRSDVGERMRPLVFSDGWPSDDAALDVADAIVLFCDGRDGEHFAEALHLESPERIARVERLMRRGCGLALIHFGTFAAQRDAARALDWCGGYFQWQGGARGGARALAGRTPAGPARP